ncbi:winged helix-turn-helix domain-containing protein [Candidatus Hodarchaeum mangrovi]
MNKNRDKRKILYDYWNSIPSYKFVDVEKDKYFNQPIRRAIIRVMRKGFEEDEGKRHVLNVIEIQSLLKEKEGIDITKTNLYFHLNILEELNLIKTVTTLLEGPFKRNKTKYFSRVARNLFISDECMNLSETQKYCMEFKKLAEIKGFSLPANYNELPKKIIDTQFDFERKLGKWLVENEEIIGEENMNNIFQIVKMINYINPKYINLYKELFEILKKEIEGL